MFHDPQWSGETTLTALAGVKLWRVRVCLDDTYPFDPIGVQLGVDVVRL